MGNLIGAGSDGTIFEYGRRCVVKFSWPNVHDARYERMSWMVDRLRGRDWVCRVFELRRLGDHKWMSVMERLEKLSAAEEILVNRVGVRAIKEFGESEKCNRLAEELRRLKKECGMHYGDLHGGNVMKRGERWKLIDLDGFFYDMKEHQVYGDESST